MIKKILLVCSVLTLSACFGGGAEIPKDNFYRLNDISQANKAEASPFKVVAVTSMKSDALHRERAILYSNTREPLHIQRYNYHHWTQVPNELIQEHLIDYLRKTEFAPQVVRYGEVVQVDARVSGYIKRFERVIDGGEVKVQVRLELHLESLGNNRQHYQFIYDAEQATQGASMHATVNAFSLALENIYQQFLTDLTKAKL